jgi:hypothetical protein
MWAVNYRELPAGRAEVPTISGSVDAGATIAELMTSLRQKALHPEGSELSALEYLLEGHNTMPEHRGFFSGNVAASFLDLSLHIRTVL